MSRRYIRDKNGRFASTAASGSAMSGARRPRTRKPGGSMTRTLRATTEALKESDRRTGLALTGRAAGPILSRGRRATAPASFAGNSLREALGSGFRGLAQSDARLYRGLAAELQPKKLKGRTTKRLKGSS